MIDLELVGHLVFERGNDSFSPKTKLPTSSKQHFSNECSLVLNRLPIE